MSIAVEIELARRWWSRTFGRYDEIVIGFDRKTVEFTVHLEDVKPYSSRIVDDARRHEKVTSGRWGFSAAWSSSDKRYTIYLSVPKKDVHGG